MNYIVKANSLHVKGRDFKKGDVVKDIFFTEQSANDMVAAGAIESEVAPVVDAPKKTKKDEPTV